jgi:hypothetical protein
MQTSCWVALVTVLPAKQKGLRTEHRHKKKERGMGTFFFS